MQEVEMKAWLRMEEELVRVREFLIERGHFLRKTVKQDIYFAKPEAHMPAFRIREVEGKYFVNQKKRKLERTMEHNEELEFLVSDKNAFLDLVHNLGYVVFIEKTKFVEVYRLEEKILAEIVKIPELGYFLEIEALCETASAEKKADRKIQALFRELDLEKNAESREYTTLLQEQKSLSEKT